MELVSHIAETRSRLAAETAERAQLITALLPAAQDAAAYDLYVLVIPPMYIFTCTDISVITINQIYYAVYIYKYMNRR